MSDDTTCQLSMFLPEAFPARTFPQQAKARVSLKETAAASGSSLPELLANYDHMSCSWKTYQPLLQMAERSLLRSLPRWGMARSGALYQLQPLALHTFGTDGSAWPTPTASDDMNRAPGSPVMTSNGTIRRQNARGEQSFMRLSQVVQLWPTPTVDASKNNGSPTRNSTHSPGLDAIVKLWPTPAAQDGKNSSLPPSQANRDTLPGELIRQRVPVANEDRTALNPEWCESLMGFPLGWTDLTGGQPSPDNLNMTGNHHEP